MTGKWFILGWSVAVVAGATFVNMAPRPDKAEMMVVMAGLPLLMLIFTIWMTWWVK